MNTMITNRERIKEDRLWSDIITGIYLSNILKLVLDILCKSQEQLKLTSS